MVEVVWEGRLEAGWRVAVEAWLVAWGPFAIEGARAELVRGDEARGYDTVKVSVPLRR
jgi:hypothetical protein